MRIANPIYDAAFKYLMEDTEIAKGLIGKIIGEEIVELSLRPKEIISKDDDYPVIIFRIDFKAIIKTKTDEYKNVIIEIQKGKNPKDIIRFRRYLAENYRKKDEIKTDKGATEKMTLPIISIYFLGFPLHRVPTPVMKANRQYKDLVLGLELTEKEDFIEKLTHDGYFVQIPRLDKKERNELEGILKIFNQSYRIEEDGRLIEISEAELSKYPLLEKIGNRLLKAAATKEVLYEMEIQEEVIEQLEEHLREKAELKEKIEEQQRLIEELKRKLGDKN